MYQSLLEQLLRAVQGADAALLLDSEGEVVVEAGEKGERQRLIGAYQGLVLQAIRRLADQYEQGSLHYLVRRHNQGTVILRPLKDGYYLVVSLRPGVPVALGVHQSSVTQERMNEEL
jgi:predicted regulator of Ras-like GTPase activity (Roadblock/LC7/MglB family)